MPSNFHTVVPSSLARAKRIAKQLKECYPTRTLSECQATTAHLLGHSDWHALSKAIESGAPPGPFDEDIPREAGLARGRRQIEILCLELGKTDPNGQYLRPDPPESKPVLTHEELAAHALAIEFQVEERMQMAHGRFQLIYAPLVLFELGPSYSMQLPRDTYAALKSETPCEKFAEVPRLLGRWWLKNIPYQPEVGASLSSLELDPHSQTSILRFSQYFGTLCCYYSRVINWTMMMGVGYILGQRFSSIGTQKSMAFYKFSEQMKASNAKADVAPLNEEFENQMSMFFTAFPRDDLEGVWLAQPRALEESAKKVLAIFADPESKRGTWTEPD